MDQDLIEITEASVLRDALLAYARTTLGRERAIAEELAARAEEIAEATTGWYVSA